MSKNFYRYIDYVRAFNLFKNLDLPVYMINTKAYNRNTFVVNDHYYNIFENHGFLRWLLTCSFREEYDDLEWVTKACRSEYHGRAQHERYEDNKQISVYEEFLVGNFEKITKLAQEKDLRKQLFQIVLDIEDNKYDMDAYIEERNKRWAEEEKEFIEKQKAKENNK